MRTTSSVSKSSLRTDLFSRGPARALRCIGLPQQMPEHFPRRAFCVCTRQLDQLLDFVAHAFRDDEAQQINGAMRGRVRQRDCRTVFLFQASVEKMMTKATWRSRMTIEGPDACATTHCSCVLLVWATTLLPSRLSAWFTLTTEELRSPCNMSLAPQAAAAKLGVEVAVGQRGSHHRFQSRMFGT